MYCNCIVFRFQVVEVVQEVPYIVAKVAQLDYTVDDGVLHDDYFGCLYNVSILRFKNLLKHFEALHMNIWIF